MTDVVIVDDDEDLLRMIVFGFESNGLEVKTLSSGKEALEYFSDDKIISSTKLLILDRLLPDMDGLDILKRLSEKFPKKLPMVLFLSVLAAEKDVLSGFKAGAIDYLTKPFSLHVLMDKSLALLSRYK